MIGIRARSGSSVTTALLATLALACGAGGDELDEALRTVAENDLAIMVLPQQELGGEFADLEIDEDSGFTDNEENADDTIDPADTATDLEQAGRIIGYSLRYSDPTFSALAAGDGLVSVGTSVQLFERADDASAYVDQQLDDTRRFEGEEVEPGLTLQEFDTFAVKDLADQATGLRYHIGFIDAETYQTVVVFTLGRLLGAAFITKADDADVDAQVEEIARALEERIVGVLLGDIAGTPVPLPAPEEEEEAAPPQGGPDLAQMALSLDDFPPGVTIDREGYVADEDTVASYEREFDLGIVLLGGSELIGLENDIALYQSALEASAILAASESIFTGESAAEFAASFASEGAGFEVTNPRIDPIPLPDLGDGSFAVSFTYDTPLGTFENIFVYVQVGRALGTLILTEEPGKVSISDVLPLAEAMTARTRAVLAAEP